MAETERNEQQHEEAEAPGAAEQVEEAPSEAVTEAPAAPAPSRRPARRKLLLARRGLEWLPALVAAPFLLLFLIVVLQRFASPWELEWMEGHSGEQAWRFAKGLPLYPTPDDGWVPYMYGPLYHMLFGTLMKLSGVYSLAWGRAISLFFTFAAAGALLTIVRDRTRRWAPAVAATLLFFAYFKPTGYWYDIVRIDSMALGLGAWGMYFTLKRNVTFWQGILGLVLLFAATFTKQSMGFVAVGCGVCLLVRAPRAAIIGGVTLLVALVNIIFVVSKTGNEAFLRYVMEAPYRHPSITSIYYPGGESEEQFLARFDGESPTLWAKASLYLARHFESPAPLWENAFRHVWLIGLLVACWLLLCLINLHRPRGWLYFIPSFFLIGIAIKAYGLYGGFLNNFMTLFFGVSLMAGFAFDGLRRETAGWGRWLALAAVPLVLVLQILQPWRLPAPDANAIFYEEWRKEYDPEVRKEIDQWREYLRQVEVLRKEDAERPDVSFGTRVLYQLSRYNAAGLTYFPSQQLSHPDAADAYRAMIDWLYDKKAADEQVAILHHQWYGILTGHELTTNVDAVRCAIWAGERLPRKFLQDIRTGRYEWIVLDNTEPKYDWLPGEVQQAIAQYYGNAGQFPPLKKYGHNALAPRDRGAGTANAVVQEEMRGVKKWLVVSA